MKRLFTYGVLLVSIGVSMYSSSAQTAGKGRVEGRVIEAKSNEGIPGANILVKGTYYGGSSNIDGLVKIENVNPGTYTIEVSLLGFKTVQFTGVKVEAGQTTKITAKMEESVLALGQEIVVVGEKPLFDIEETASRRNITQADIQATAVQNVQGIVALQAGVVFADNEIHIRGGRTHENAYLVDGVSVQDPLAGTGFGLQLSPASIQEVEVITGGYNAEYGQATSGIVNITTREGSDKYSGSISYKVDHYGLNKDSRSNWNTDIYDASLSGPEPLTSYLLPALGLEIPGEMSFFGTFYANLNDGYLRWVEVISRDGRPIGFQAIAPNRLYSSVYPKLFGSWDSSPRRSNNYSWLAKLTYKPMTTLKLGYTYNQSVVIDQNTQTIQATLERVEPNPGYQYLFQYIPDSANTFTQLNIQHSFSLTHTLSSQTFYEVRFSRYTARVRGDANGKNFDNYIEPVDIITYPIRYYNQNTDTVGVIPGDGFYDIGAPTSWRDQYSNEFTFKFDLTNYFSEKNKFKAGLEMRFQELQMADIVRPWVKLLGFDNDIYAVFPALGALYAQDNITLSGMILNFGVRLDYWIPGKYVDDVADDTSSSLLVSPALREQYRNSTFKLFGRRWKARLSPRLGISHPISDNQTLFFSYGHFSKFPRPQFVYSKLQRTSVRSNLPVGNPNLNPETTVSYELGIRNQLSGDDVLTVTAYYKDIFDYITEKTVRRVSGTGGSQFYSTYLNSDYARVRGLELEYKKRIGNWFRGSLSGSYSIATGKSSSPNEEAIRLQQGEPESIKENFLIWDRPVQISANLNFTVPKGEPLFDFGEDILDDYSIFARVFFQSGKRYTPQRLVSYNSTTGRPEYFSDRENLNEEVGANWFYIDLTFEKFFDLGFGKLIARIEIENLLDNQNTQIVNPITGTAYEYETSDGKPTRTPNSWNDPHYPQLTGDISPFPYNPARYLSPRTVRLSLAFRF
ncbi:MAG: TonB-dependent receptor [Ignavibacteriae bacterium]|nr:TonB-dependent receptor [Ignavibacteriota bacterium]